jgi:primosomal protein N' (replication factor Y) (superfamily II helicase)
LPFPIPGGRKPRPYKTHPPMKLPPDIIEVAVPLPVEGSFHYRLPAELISLAEPGKRVLVPFGRRKVTGYILGRTKAPETELREVIEILDPEPLFNADELEFFRWAAAYYLHPLGEVIRAALPPGINLTSRLQEGEEVMAGGAAALTEKFYTIATEPGVPPRLGAKGGEILDWLRSEGEAPVSRIRERFPAPYAPLKRLVELGLVVEETREVYRDPFRDEPAGRDEPHELNPHQAAALEEIAAAVAAGKFSPFLLHGITGSGKTEVYLRAIAAVLERGKSALVLVPEIALTPQLVGRFRRRFGCGIAVLHSGLSAGERYDEWRRIRRGEASIVIGARSAVFAPITGIGIVVVDEEHEGSYKQSEGFRYNARDLALVRGKMAGAAVVLGSATPLVTSYHAATEGKLRLLELPGRVRDLPLPDVRLIDMRDRKRALLAPSLVTALRENLEAGGQTLLFLNRRGFATFLICGGCGHVFRCPNCSVTLTYHKGRGRNYCHYCDYSLPAPSLCPGCGSGDISLLGQGTERIEEEVATLFPEARIARMDRDTTTAKGSHVRILRGLADGSIDILIGTQMIAKGHDFPGVTLVGVVSADGSLNLPDFRSAERAFQLVTQVIGRAGRGDAPGRVLVQTLSPDHYALERAVAHDFDGFCRDEISFREETGYPPFSFLAALHFSGNLEPQVRRGAEEAAEMLRRLVRERRGRVEILGPAAAPLSRVRGKFRWQILLKAYRRGSLHPLLASCRSLWTPPAGVRLGVDIDPVDLL